MFARAYLVLGVLVLAGYAATAYLGWEFGDPVRLAAAPPAGASAQSASGGASSGSSSSYGGRATGVGGFGGK
jgi:hypothetical protein